MYFAEARFYDAGNRTWLSRDPAKDGLNWYEYCGSSPTVYFDPTGEIPIVIAFIIGGAIIGGLVTGATSAVIQYKETGKIDGGKVAAHALVGAIGGAFVGLGVGGFAAAVAAPTAIGTVAASTSVASTIVGGLSALGGLGTAAMVSSLFTGGGIVTRGLETAANPNLSPRQSISYGIDTYSTTKDATVGAIVGAGTYAAWFGTRELVNSVNESINSIRESVRSRFYKNGCETSNSTGSGNNGNTTPNAQTGGNNGINNSSNYAQRTYANEFSREGSRIYSEMAGEKIKTIDDMVNAIRNGRINPKDIKVDYIVRDGNTLILNTRTTQALTQAGIPRSEWYTINRTGVQMFEGMLDDQLMRNSLSSSGISEVIPKMRIK